MLRSAALAALTVFATACSSDTTTRSSEEYTVTLTPREQGDAMERSITKGFGLSPDVHVTEATCPDIDPDGPGTYRCDVVADAVPFQMKVTMTPEPQPDGSSRMKVGAAAEGVVFVGNIAESMTEQIREQSGKAAEVTCAPPELRPSIPGGRFQCTATDLQSGQSAPLVITLTNEQGGFGAQPGTL